MKHPYRQAPRCSRCGQYAVLRASRDVYPGKKDYGNFWVCPTKTCDAFVGCHKDTIRPLGELADAETRKWRKHTHICFDPIWKTGKMDRKEAYRILAAHMHIHPDKCHIAMFDVKQCHAAINATREIKFHQKML